MIFGSTAIDGQRWLWGGASHPGGRSEQQDRWGVFVPLEKDGVLAVVADGLGGHRDGALAAQAVVDAAEMFLHLESAALRLRPREALPCLCQQAQAAVSGVSPQAHSTLVVLWLYQDQAHWLHVGDSRFYQLRAGERLLRTRDHSAAQLLLDLGEISEAEMATHPDQNRLYRSLGSGSTAKPEIGSGTVMSEDLLILCSDGLWEHISEAELWAAADTKKLTLLASDLVESATKRGGERADNATLILIRPSLRTGGWSWLRRLYRG
jgi:serine/threonine protein phosphatase PrpC